MRLDNVERQKVKSAADILVNMAEKHGLSSVVDCLNTCWGPGSNKNSSVWHQLALLSSNTAPANPFESHRKGQGVFRCLKALEQGRGLVGMSIL